MMLLGVIAAQRTIAAVVNLLTNGDFVQAGAGWLAIYDDSQGDSGPAGTDLVSFVGGSCQLKFGGNDEVAYYPRITRGLNVAPVAGATYEVGFDLSWDGSADGEAFYVLLGGKYQTYVPIKGRVVMQISASSSSQTFALSGSRYSGPLVVDNITVTKS